MQNFTLNLSLNINIGTDGQVKVDVNTDKPQSIAVPHTPVIDVTPEPKVEEKSVVAKNSTTEEVVKPKKTKSKKREADVKPEPAVDTEPVEESGPELEPVAEHNSTAISESGSAAEPVAEPERAVAPEPVAEPEQAVVPPPPPAPKAVEPEVVEPTGKSDGQVLFEEALSDLGALTGFDITPDDFTFKKEGAWVNATETDTQAETSSDFEKAAGEFVDFLYGGNDTPKAEAKPEPVATPEPAVVPPPPAPSAAPVPPAPASAQVPPPPPAGPFGGVPTPPPAPNVAMPTPPAPPVGGTPVAPKSEAEQLGGAAQPSTPSEQSKKNHRWQNLGFTNPEFAKKLDVNYRTATNGKQTTVAVVSPVPEVTPDDDSYTTFDTDMKTYRLNGKVVTPMRYLKAMHAAGNMLEMEGDPNDYRVCIDLNRPYAKPRMRNGDPAYFHPYYAEDQLDLDPMESWENWEDENVRRELRENENYIHDTMLFFGITPELATTLCEADRQAMSVLGKLLAEAPDLPFIPEIREPWLAEYVAMKLGMKSVWYAGDGEYEFINGKKGNKLVDVVM